MSQLGVSRDTALVFYGDNNNWFAAFAYWVAKLYGHPRAALMNGGRKKWELEGRPFTTAVPEITRATYRSRELDRGLRAFVGDMLAAGDGTRLVDVRSPAEFNGEIVAPAGVLETAQRRGHVPRAVNVPWVEAANEDGTFKGASELRELYASAGITPDTSVIAYCRIGERSSHTWFVLKELLGVRDVRNYDGSWTEYGNLIGVPIDNPAAGRPAVPV